MVINSLYGGIYVNKYQDKIKGCMLGGAIGDALGYPIEFITYPTIQSIYGQEGILGYECDPYARKAVISDDTQMTLFTAEGILRCQDRTKEKEIRDSIYVSYLHWLSTQNGLGSTVDSELLKIPELHHLRAPGDTCLFALESGKMGSIKEPLNHSKGCGGIMRVAPIAVLKDYDIYELDRLGAEAAAITHGHPLGYMTAAVLVHIIYRIIYGGCSRGNHLEDIVLEARESINEIFIENKFLEELNDVIKKAIEKAKNDKSDMKNIEDIGEGWVAEETLGIALYCSLRYKDDFSRALRVSVNHSGDSDSTGAVTGNIMGALWGYSKIPERWKENLQLTDVILKIAGELSTIG